MKHMSDYIAKLEGFPDLEVSIIRQTKINKVLKAILKLEQIPKEAEFNFKTRSQNLLDKWNKILSSNEGAAAPATNGVNGNAEKKASATPAPAANGVEEEEEGAKGAEKEEKSDKASEKPEAEEKKEDESKEQVNGYRFLRVEKTTEG